MSGVEAITIVQLIGACIDITKAVNDIGRAAKDAKGLPPKLKELFERLPAIIDLLNSARERAEKDEISEESKESIKPVLAHCKESLDALRILFWKACPEDGDNYGKRLWKGTKTVFLGRDSRLQKHMSDIMENLNLLELKGIFSIDNKLDDLTETVQILAEEDTTVRNAHSGSGNLNVHEGPGNQYNIGGGSNNTFNQNFGTHIHEGHSKIPLPEQCLRSLAFPDMEARSDINEKAEHTCEWIFEHEDYQTWMGRGGLLWIKGRAGTGKSTLMEAIRARSLPAREKSFEHLSPTRRTLVVSFFFNRRGEMLHQTAVGLFRSLLHQVLRCDDDLLSQFTKDSGFADYHRTKGEPGRDKTWDWTESDLRDLFRKYVKKFIETNDLRLYVDALDEGGEQVARQLMALFESCRGEIGHELNICVSCRPYPQRLSSYDYCIEIVNQTQQDISRFLEEYCSEWSDWSDPQALQRVKKEILSRASGVFQWVIIVIGRVVKLRDENLATILASIASLPQDLNDLYHDMFKPLRAENSSDRRAALRLFRWMTFAKGRLSLGELRYAAAIDADSPLKFVNDCKHSAHWCEDDDKMLKRLQRLSFGVVKLDGSYVQFDHESVRDYMLARGISSFERDQADPSLDNVVGKSEAILSRVCFRYLAAHDVLKRSEEVLKAFESGRPGWSRHSQLDPEANPELQLGQYARSFCWKHAYAAEAEGRSLKEIVKITNWPLFKCAYAFSMIRDPGINKDLTLLHLAAHFGITSIFEEVLSRESKSDLNPKDRWSRTPLWYASCRRHQAIVKLLVNSGRVEVNSTDTKQRSPFAIAVHEGHEEVIRLLLESQRVDMNSYVFSDLKTPFAIAVDKGYEGVLVPLLKNARVDVNPRDYQQKTPFATAVESGDELMTRMLLGCSRVDVNTRNEIGSTPLLTAMYKAHKRIVRLLLESDRVDVNLPDPWGYTPLWTALYKTDLDEDIVKLLLKIERLNVNSRHDGSETALAEAARCGAETSVRLLLKSERVDVNCQDDMLRTPLSLASGNGYQDTAKLLLLRSDIDPNAWDLGRKTPLWHAAYEGHENITKMLLEDSRVRKWTKNNFGWTPLWAAVVRGHAQIVKLFWEGGFIDMNSRHYSDSGETLLELAASHSHAHILRLLIETGEIDLDMHDVSYYFGRAASDGGKETVKALLGTDEVGKGKNKGVDIRIPEPP
ncbi:Alpha-latrotoxin-Lh1a [Cercospora beticola]|uniref:Alpha-latrotoxin-Lh1a n=1 Tax=Cercospora beticola TaxID=122368 RepID=A0A2G5IEH1_CERBT|nr:Alpha-latrotoxin-Lh1a [Cercospora beticola]PIB03175.1 Alpha-latrotoxin-Lh1a [Cercospora beticola]WPB04444.1 hypothetical protein RHO25_009090 [Cercospora beticola]